MKVRYYGHVGQMTGYGKAAESTCLALLAVGCELEIRPLAPFESLNVDPDLPLAGCLRRDWELTQPDAVIVHTLPLSCPSVIELAELSALDVPVVAYTTWEGAGHVPAEMAAALQSFDSLWVPSAQNLMAFDTQLGRTIKLAVVPHAFNAARLENPPRRYPRDDPEDRFHFYYVGAWNSRKNPEGVIRAFTRAFTKDYPVRLTIHSLGASEADFAVALHRTGFTQQNMPRISFANRSAPEAVIDQLHHNVGDCFVTASRGEGWNLPAFDAVVAKRMVISPHGMGSDEFLIGTTTRFVDSYCQPAGVDARVHELREGAFGIEVVGAQGQTTQTEWRDPDLIQLADQMKDVYQGQHRTLGIHYNLAERFSYDTVGMKILHLLEGL